MNNPERQEFIEKFRREQGLDPIFNKSKINTSQISSKTHKNNTGYLKTNASTNKLNQRENSKGFNTINNVNNRSKAYLDKSVEDINLNSSIINSNFQKTDYVPRRWDYLHQLERVKQEKIKHKKSQQQKENDLKIQQECTFSPVFYTKLSNRSKSKSLGKFGSGSTNKVKKISNIKALNSSGDISISNHNITYTSEMMNTNSITNNNIVKFTQPLNSENELLSCDVNQRTLIWTRKKANKTESMKQQLHDREVQECNFRPKLVSKNIDKFKYSVNTNQKKIIESKTN